MFEDDAVAREKKRRQWNGLTISRPKDVWDQVREVENNQRILNNLSNYSKLDNERYNSIGIHYDE